MKKILFFISIMILSLSFAACNDDNDNNENIKDPVITDILPNSGKIRDKIIIRGENFKANNTNVVYFSGGVIGRVVDCSSTELLVVVPDSGAISGPVTVRTGHERYAVSSKSFAIDKSKPYITLVNPPAGNPHDEIVIRGANFSEIPTDNIVTFDGIEAEVVFTSEYRLRVLVPETVPAGTLDLLVTVNGKESNMVTFQVGNLFSDNFNRGTDVPATGPGSTALGTPWKVLGGSFAIEAGVMVSAVTGEYSIYYDDVEAQTTAGNGSSFVLSTEMSFNASGAAFCGLVFNYQADNGGFYVVRLSSGLLQVLKKATGSSGWANLNANADASLIVKGTNYEVEVVSNIAGTFDVKVTNKESGSVIFEQRFTDASPLTKGYAGYYAIGNVSRFDNFSLLVK